MLNELFALPADILSGREKDGITYPVAMYDHDEGRAVTGGFAYHGRIAALRASSSSATSRTDVCLRPISPR